MSLLSPNFRADLHTHTTCSDGILTPEQLIKEAKKQGLSGLSITDHDTLSAYETAFPIAEQENILLGTGIEISSWMKDTSIHILGYAIDIRSEALQALCTQNKQERSIRNKKIINILGKKNMPIDEEKLIQLESLGVTVGRPHIAKLLVDAGYVSSIKEAFNRYLADGACCYVQRELPSPAKAIEVIHEAGGKAFIAHPHLIKNKKFLLSLLEEPFDGIECYWGLSSPTQEKYLLNIASSRHLLISGGSDYHGYSHTHLGSSWVDALSFSAIFEETV